jgi:pimeloyl-ACP methyl ester carboxylesterase
MSDEFVDSLYSHFDHGTQRAILKLYRSAPAELLAASGSELGTITAPSLVLWPTEDPFIPQRFGAAYAEALGGELEIIEGAGHWTWLDRPELVEMVTQFLGR